jgi:2'-5' RNA ligase
MNPDTQTSPPPLIVTLKPDDKSHRFFTGLRKQYFPPAINYLEAHLTLFHHLPSDNPEVNDALAEMANRASFEMQVAGLMHTGFGVAFTIESADLVALRSSLQHRFHEWLIPQDKQKFRPHITIQNKVTPLESKELYRELSENFKLFSITAVGFDTWLYKNGPWEHLESYLFNT